jgi:hypothetical protein
VDAALWNFDGEAAPILKEIKKEHDECVEEDKR